MNTSDDMLAGWELLRRAKEAITGGDGDEARRLLSSLPAGTDVDEAVDDDGVTLLMLAAWHGRLDCLELLLQAGADPTRRTVFGESAVLLEHGGGQFADEEERGRALALLDASIADKSAFTLGAHVVRLNAAGDRVADVGGVREALDTEMIEGDLPNVDWHRSFVPRVWLLAAEVGGAASAISRGIRRAGVFGDYTFQFHPLAGA